MSPLLPSVMITLPSHSCAASGMNTPTLFDSALLTSGASTICGKFGEPISSSPSATSTRLTGILRPAPRIAWSAASSADCGPF